MMVWGGEKGGGTLGGRGESWICSCTVDSVMNSVIANGQDKALLTIPMGSAKKNLQDHSQATEK